MATYEISLSRKGEHLFATHERSIMSEHKLLDLVALFAAKFPEAEGYEIKVTEYVTSGTDRPLTALLAKGRRLRRVPVVSPARIPAAEKGIEWKTVSTETPPPPHGIDWKKVPRQALIDALRNANQGPSNLSRQDKFDLIDTAERALRQLSEDRRASLIAGILEEAEYQRNRKVKKSA